LIETRRVSDIYSGKLIPLKDKKVEMDFEFPDEQPQAPKSFFHRLSDYIANSLAAESEIPAPQTNAFTYSLFYVFFD